MGSGEQFDHKLCLRFLIWIIQGHIGAGERGLHFLEEEEIIPTILEIAEASPIPALRGSVFH